MELFLPGLMVLIVSAIFAFFVIPRTGTIILAVVCLLTLIAAGIHHYSTFYSEYQLSTWQNGLKENAIFVILGLAILAIISSIFFFFTGSSSSEETPMETIQNAVANAATNMPSANSATNPLTAAINTGLKNIMGPTGAPGTGGVTGAVTGAVNTVSNAAKNAMKAVSNVLPGGRAPNAQRSNQNPPQSATIPGLGFRASEI